MSIEMENPQTLVELIDASANWVAQIHLAYAIGDKNHISKAINEAERLLSIALEKAEELEN